MLSPAPPPTLLTLEEAARRLGIGRTLLRRLLASGELPDVHLGRRHLVPSTAVDRFIEDCVPGHVEAEADLESGPGARARDGGADGAAHSPR